MSDTTAGNDPLEPLVRRYLLSGDEEAMDRLVERTRPKLQTVARRIGAPQDAEDAVQGAYMALLRKRGSDLEAPVMPWLLTTVIRLAYRRKAKQRRQRELARRLAQPRKPGTPGGAAPDAGVLEAEREVLVRAAVARLPAIYRDAVVLRHLEGLSTRETAALLDVSEGALRTRLHRGARLLKGRMSPALLGLLLALPWWVSDLTQRLVPLTRPFTARPYASAALLGGLVLGSVMLFGGFSGTPAGAVPQAPQPTTVGSSPNEPPTPVVLPEGQATSPSEEPPDKRDDPPPPHALSQPALPTAAGPREEHGKANKAEEQEDLEPPSAPDVLPIDAGANQDVPEPPGMVLLDGGHVSIGTDTGDLDKLLAGRPEGHRKFFAYEAPRHRAFLRPYYIGRYEVTNAQYLRFLQDHRSTYTIGRDRADSLESAAAKLVDPPNAQPSSKREGVWRQLYYANKERIWKALGPRLDKLIVQRPGGKVDEAKTAEALRRQRLPSGLTLEFCSLSPPSVWPGMAPLPGTEDHPVRSISYDDAERFAEWAGMHIPTEQEWEWAARGAEGRVFPWGDTWYPDTSRANWGGQVTDDHHETATLPVDSRGAPPAQATPGATPSGDGRSWCGVHHLCGNVAEWTSSWFVAYPGQERPNNFMGRWIKIIRGGGAADGESLVLRSACRNWVGGGPDAPPYPESAFGWVGFRLAAWRVPGRDQVPPMLRRVLQHRRLKPEDIDVDRFAAFVTRDWAAPDAAPANHVYVRGRSRSVVFLPVTSLLREGGMLAMKQAWKRPAKLRGARGRLQGINGKDPSWILGALHTDLPLEGVDVPSGEASPKKSSRGRAKPPGTRPGTLAPGTYLVVAWHDRIALTSTALEFRGFLPELESGDPALRVLRRASKELRPPALRPALQSDQGDLDVQIPFGGKTARDSYVLHIRARLPFEPGALDAHGPWLRSR